VCSELDEAIDCMRRAVRAAWPPDGSPTLETIAAALRNMHGADDLDRMVRRVLLAMLEQRGTRQETRSEWEGVDTNE
jgi:hypothetical protein